MSTYRKIHGRSIQAVTTDPTESVAEGQVWYNTTSDTFKSVLINEAWVSASPMSTFRYGTAGGGTQSAAFVGGGYPTPSPDPTNVTEEYNGSGWSSGGNMNTARMYIGGSGTQTAGLASGGDEYPSPRYSVLVEEYDGSSWTVQNTLPTQNKNMGSCGTQTASLNIGGSVPAATNVTNSYDGTNWTNTGHNLNTARFSLRAVGTTTSALVNGGNPNLQTTEEYDGSSWTSASNSVSNFDAHSSAGTQTAARMFGGFPSPSVQHNFYDGSSWSTAPNLGTGRYYGALGPIGTSTAALMAGGNASPSPVTGVATEEFTSSANVITAAAWASIANFPDSRAYSGGSGGAPTSTLVFGGYTGPGLGGFVSSGAEFDGSSWTATGDYVIDVVGVAGLGPVTAGLGCGGYKDNATNVTTSAEYDGSSWTSGNSANVAGQGAKMAGIQTAASMGNRSGDTDGHEQYDGTNWTAAANTPDAKGAGSMMAGTQTALLMYGGEASGERNKTELFDGSSWTSGSNMNLDRRQGSHGGTQTYAIAGGGDSNPGIFGNTELWDGTSWVSSVSMGTARFYQVGGNSVGPSGVTSNIAATGRTPGSTHSNNCEEFSSETTALNVKTLTQS